MDVDPTVGRFDPSVCSLVYASAFWRRRSYAINAEHYIDATRRSLTCTSNEQRHVVT